MRFTQWRSENEEKAKHIAMSYKGCPYVSLMATKGTGLFATFFLPERQRWWIEYVGRKPRETLGLDKADVTVADTVLYPKRLKMRLPWKPRSVSPCGANCRTCPAYKERCVGCPATMFYTLGGE